MVVLNNPEIIKAQVPRDERSCGLIAREAMPQHERSPLDNDILMKLYDIHLSGEHFKVTTLGQAWRLSRHFEANDVMVDAVVAESTPDNQGKYKLEAYCVLTHPDSLTYAEHHFAEGQVNSDGSVTIDESVITGDDVHTADVLDDDLFHRVVYAAYAELQAEGQPELPPTA